MVYQALRIDPREHPAQPWRGLFRIEARAGAVADVDRGLAAIQPERTLLAQGDAWIGRFAAPGPHSANLLDALRAPFLTAVVDAAHVGDQVAEMVTGQQKLQTRALLDRFAFDAILLSAGGNDVRALFRREFAERVRPWTLAEVIQLADPARHRDFFAPVMAHIDRFFDLRDASENNATTPILLHGYDFIQPRPAGGQVFAGSRVGGGPWLHPLLREANLDDVQMRAAADAVIDQLNVQLRARCAQRRNVIFLDQRGLLTPADPGSTGPSKDWMDEIHPSEAGFARLACHRWDVLLAQTLGWRFHADDLQPAQAGATASTARKDPAAAAELFRDWAPSG